MQTISEDYRRLNAELHESNSKYGTSGSRYANQVRELCKTIETRDVLDYGCGKSTLQNNLPFTIKQYDPAIEKYSSIPEPADVVVCTDVLEHIEPEYLDNVLDDLKRVTKKLAFFTVATRPAQKTLSDGRNAHLIQEPVEWWVPKLCERFTLSMLQNFGSAFLVILEAKDGNA